MAVKRNAATELARMLPNSVTIKDGDIAIRVAGDATENRTLNYFLAAQIRALLEKNIKKYSDIEQPMTPKELKELADAGRSLAEFSAEVYRGAESLASEDRQIEATPVQAVDFSAMTTKQDDNPASPPGKPTD